MASHVKNEKASIEKKLAQVRKQLEEREPVLMAELHALEVRLHHCSIDESDRYAKIRTPKAATRAVLEYERKRLTKREIADRLHRGGYAMHPEHGRRLIVDSISHNIPRGTFLEIDGKVGLPEWGDSTEFQ